MRPSALLCTLCSLPPGLCTGVGEHPSLVLELALPSLPAKQLLEGANSAPRGVPFIPTVHHPPDEHCRTPGVMGALRGLARVAPWVPSGLVPALWLLQRCSDCPPAPPAAGECRKEEGKQGFCSCGRLSAVTLSQLLLLVPLRAFNWSLFLIGGRSFGENWKFGSGSF